MRILDIDSGNAVSDAQIYFTKTEAEECVRSLSELLKNPQAIAHKHLITDGCEIAYSIVTPAKCTKGYMRREQRLIEKNQ